jgi:hypothetical protein
MIRRIFGAAVIAIMALSLVGSTRAQTTGDKSVWITGFGVQSCGKLLSRAPGAPEADAITYNAALSWIDGYLSGANTARWEGKHDPWRDSKAATCGSQAIVAFIRSMPSGRPLVRLIMSS